MVSHDSPEEPVPFGPQEFLVLGFDIRGHEGHANLNDQGQLNCFKALCGPSHQVVAVVWQQLVHSEDEDSLLNERGASQSIFFSAVILWNQATCDAVVLHTQLVEVPIVQENIIF